MEHPPYPFVPIGYELGWALGNIVVIVVKRKNTQCPSGPRPYYQVK